MQIAATQILSSQPQWHAASLALQNGEIPKLTIPIASAAELGQIGQHLQIKLTPEHLHALAKANIKFPSISIPRMKRCSPRTMCFHPYLLPVR